LNLNYNFRKLIIVPALFLLVLTVWSGSRLLAGSFSTAAVGRAEELKEIAGYRSWTMVNTEPQLMDAQTAQDCALSPRIGNANGLNPHQNKYILVYVNATGREAMMETRNPSFPVGSVIVKEKLPDKSSQTPELLTVMIKHEKGFNPATGDWEFMVVDGNGTKVESRGKLKNCQGCHLARPQTDYIFRSYLPYDVRNKLK
jgi:hypothetical protein